MWAFDFLSALIVINRTRRRERMGMTPATEIIDWRPRRPGIYLVALGVSARHGLHPPAFETHRADQQLMPYLCTAHRVIGRLTSGFRLPGRPMVCLSLDGVRFPAICAQGKGTSLAVIVFQDQIEPEAVASTQRIKEHALWRTYAASVQYVAAPRDEVCGRLGIALTTGTFAVVVEREHRGRKDGQPHSSRPSHL
jgi:hypothetical protein